MQLITGWMIFILSCVGHTEWWVMTINRSFSFPIKATKLRRFRTLHDLGIVSFPFLLTWKCGIGSHGLFNGGSISDQSPLWQAVLVFTLLGIIPLFLAALRWQWKRRFEFHRVASKEFFDVAAIARQDPKLVDVRGSRWHPVMISPWNGIYTLEVNVKRIQTTNPLAASRRPLRVVHISDLHFIDCPGADFYRFVVSKMLEQNADTFVFTGDLIDKPELLEMAVDILRPLTKVAPCFFILGNHDWRYDYEHFRSTLAASGWKCVTGTHERIQLGDRNVLFAGSELPWIGNAPPSVTHAGVDLRILLGHTPDQYRFGQKCGYDVMLSGHTHGGQVVLPIIGPVYSPSLYGVSFAAGLFQLGKMTMHVSRGIGAKDPLRINCSPELTCLEIHC